MRLPEEAILAGDEAAIASDNVAVVDASNWVVAAIYLRDEFASTECKVTSPQEAIIPSSLEV